MGNAPTITDWISGLATVVGVLVALIAAWIGLKTFSHQRTAHDVGMALQIFMEINRYWDRLSEQSANYEYNIGQILAYFEIAAAMFNENVLTKSATEFLGDHTVEVFTNFQSTEDGKRIINQCRSSEKTFCELKKFADARFPQALNTLAFSERKSGN